MYNRNEILTIIKVMYSKGVKLDIIAQELNSRGYTKQRGGAFKGVNITNELTAYAPAWYEEKRRRKKYTKNKKGAALVPELPLKLDGSPLPEYDPRRPGFRCIVSPIFEETPAQETKINCNIIVKNNELFVSSLDVAQAFGKRHDNILRAIKNIKVDPDFVALNFEENNYRENRPFYLMTKTGFLFLIMGFTGNQAHKIRIAFLKEFKRMRAELEKPTPVHNDPGSWADALIMIGQSLKNNDVRISFLEKQSAQIRKTQVNAVKELQAQEISDRLPLFKTKRDLIRQRIALYSQATGTPIEILYNQLYLEFYYRYKTDLKTQARNRKITVLEMADRLGLVPELWDLCCLILKDIPEPGAGAEIERG